MIFRSITCLVAAAAPWLLSTPLPGQSTDRQPARTVRELSTLDGSRFVLVRTQGPPIVNWCWLTPAGPLEDPVGQPGLSHAVARAALRGTSARQSLDNAGEAAALDRLDRVEDEIATLLLGQDPVSLQLRGELVKARQRVDRLADLAAWERELRAAPALDASVQQITDASLLRVTTAPEGIVGVAQSFWRLREGSRLRGVHRELRTVRASSSTSAGASGVLTALRRELIGLAYLGHPYGLAYGSSTAMRPVTRQQMMDTFRNTHHPSRSVHVLVGNFDLDAAAATLRTVFARTELPVVTTRDTPQPPAGGLRRATMPPPEDTNRFGPPHAEIAIGFRLPASTRRAELDAMVEWLADGSQSFLRRALRQAGHFAAQVRGVAPFPSSSQAGLFLLEVSDIESTTATAADRFLEDLETALATAAASGPTDAEMDAVRGRVRTRLAERRLGGRALAAHVATVVGVEGRSVESALQPWPSIDAAAVRRLARRVLPEGSRTVVIRAVEK